MDLEVQGEQGEQEDKPPQEDSASLAIQSPTGSPSVMEYEDRGRRVENEKLRLYDEE